MPISEPWVWTNGQLQSLHNFQRTTGTTETRGTQQEQEQNCG